MKEICGESKNKDHAILINYTVKLRDSKVVGSNFQALVNFLLLTKIYNLRVNHMIDGKHLAMINIFVPLKSLPKPSLTVQNSAL